MYRKAIAHLNHFSLVELNLIWNQQERICRVNDSDKDGNDYSNLIDARVYEIAQK